MCICMSIMTDMYQLCVYVYLGRWCFWGCCYYQTIYNGDQQWVHKDWTHFIYDKSIMIRSWGFYYRSLTGAVPSKHIKSNKHTYKFTCIPSSPSPKFTCINAHTPTHTRAINNTHSPAYRGPPTKSFPTKSLWVKLSGRLPITFDGHENSHPL